MSEKKSANYKNWVPKGMVCACAAITTFALLCSAAIVLFIGLKNAATWAVFALLLAVFVFFGAASAWCFAAYNAFSYTGKRQLSRRIIEKIASYVVLPEGGAENGATGNYKYVLPWLEYAGFVPITLTKPYPELHPEIPLLVIGSSYFDADMLTAVDTFINRHGSAVFFVSANTVDIGGSWSATPKKDDGLLELLARSGFAVQTNLVMDPVNFRMTLPAADGSRYEHINYPFWVQVFRQEAEAIPPLLSAAKPVQFFWPSELVCTAARGKTPLPLLVSSTRSALQQPPYNTDPHGTQLAAAANGEHAAYPLAAFSERGVNAVSGISGADSARLLVVADEYCVSSAVEYTNSDANLDFMVNTVYWIARQDALLQLKNKQPAVLPFRYFESDTAFNRIIAAARIFNLVLVPLLIIGAGAALYILRRRNHA